MNVVIVFLLRVGFLKYQRTSLHKKNKCTTTTTNTTCKRSSDFRPRSYFPFGTQKSPLQQIPAMHMHPSLLGV